jgi:hypothetical protein
LEKTGAKATGRRGSHTREASQSARASIVTTAAAEARITSISCARWLTAQAAPRRPPRRHGYANSCRSAISGIRARRSAASVGATNSGRPRWE